MDQKILWNRKYSKSLTDFEISSLAKEVSKYLKPNSSILEIGCGLGNDANYFAEYGHKVVATDFSEKAIDYCKGKFSNPNISFQVKDTTRLDFDINSFDAVYSHLSLHYFSKNETLEIIDRIYQFLKQKGFLFFICKSTSDPLYGKGIKIEPEMYDYDGHIRHFFSQMYVEKLLSDMFVIEKLELGNANFYNSPSSYIKVIARVNK